MTNFHWQFPTSEQRETCNDSLAPTKLYHQYVKRAGEKKVVTDTMTNLDYVKVYKKLMIKNTYLYQKHTPLIFYKFWITDSQKQRHDHSASHLTLFFWSFMLKIRLRYLVLYLCPVSPKKANNSSSMVRAKLLISPLDSIMSSAWLALSIQKKAHQPMNGFKQRNFIILCLTMRIWVQSLTRHHWYNHIVHDTLYTLL